MDGASEQNFLKEQVLEAPLWQLCNHGAECQMHHHHTQVVTDIIDSSKNNNYYNDEQQSPS